MKEAITLLTEVQKDTSKVCPFRTNIIIYVEDNKQYQDSEFGDCYYDKCPYYDKENNSCYRIYDYE